MIDSAVIARSRLGAPALGLLAAGAVLPLVGHPGVACPLRTMTGIPCPLCGMSTSIQSTVRGQWSDAVVASPMGIVLVVIAIAVLFGARVHLERFPKWSIGAVLASMWVYQLFRFSIL